MAIHQLSPSLLSSSFFLPTPEHQVNTGTVEFPQTKYRTSLLDRPSRKSQPLAEPSVVLFSWPPGSPVGYLFTFQAFLKLPNSPIRYLSAFVIHGIVRAHPSLSRHCTPLSHCLSPLYQRETRKTTYPIPFPCYLLDD